MQFLNSEGYYVNAADFTNVQHTKVSCNLSAPNYKHWNWNNNPLEFGRFDYTLLPCLLDPCWLSLLIEKSLPSSSQVLDDAGGGNWATKRRQTRLGITAVSQFTSICPSLLQANGQDEGSMQEIIRINAPSNSTIKNRLCRKYKHRDTLGNVHGD